MLNFFEEITGGYKLKNLQKYRGFVLLSERKYSAALREFQRNLLSDRVRIQSDGIAIREDFLSYYGLGQAFQGLNEDGRAIEHYLEAVRLEPGFRDPCYPLAGLLKRRYQNIGQVVAFLETHLKLFSRGELTLLAGISFYLREDQLALLYLNMFREQGGVLEEAGTESNIPDLKLLYARSLLGSGECLKACEVFEEILAIVDSSAAGSGNFTAGGRDSQGFYLDYCLACWLSTRGRDSGGREEHLDQREHEVQTEQEEQEMRVFLDRMYLLQPTSLKVADKGVFWLSFLERSLRYQRLELCQTASRVLLEDNLSDRGVSCFQTGELYYRYGYYEQAVGQFNRCLEDGFETEWIFYYLGMIRERENRFSEAEEYYRQALKLNGQIGEYHLAAARTALKRAAKVGKQIGSVFPDFKPAYGNPAPFAEQLRVINYCIKRMGSERDRIDLAVGKGGDSPGNSGLVLGLKQEKELTLNNTISEKEESSPQLRSLEEVDLYQEKFTEALDSFSKLEGQSEKLNSEILYYHRGALACLKKGDYRQGLELLEEGIERFPDCRNLWFLKGELNFLNGQYIESRKAYRQYLALPDYRSKYPLIDGPGSSLAYQALGQIEEEIGEEERAVYYYLQGLFCNKDYQPAWEGIRRVFRGQKSRISKYLAPGSGQQSDSLEGDYYLYREWLKERWIG